MKPIYSLNACLAFGLPSFCHFGAVSDQKHLKIRLRFVHLWLNQMGEQIELGETETQISEFCKEYNGEMIDKDSYLRMVQTAEY